MIISRVEYEVNVTFHGTAELGRTYDRLPRCCPWCRSTDAQKTLFLISGSEASTSPRKAAMGNTFARQVRRE